MKRHKISLFDLLLLLLVVLVGAAAYWQLHHTAVSQPESAEVLLGDLRRNSERYTDQEAINETEEYVVSYTIRIEDMDEAALSQYAAIGDELYNAYNGSKVGKLEAVSYSEEDGVTRAKLTISIFSKFYKTYIVSLPAEMAIKVGTSVSLCREDGTNIGTGIVTWIKH